MRLLVTGANGFLGQYVVQEAVSRGHHVKAMVRPASSVPGDWSDDSSIEVVRVDLRQGSGIGASLNDVDAVLHLAAAKSGDLYEQLAATVVGTENLIRAMVEAGVSRIVSISSFSVYEYLQRKSHDNLDEESPIAVDPQVRDEYCQTKLLQERLLREAAAEHGWACGILRPGVIFGRDNEWNGRVGFPLSSRWWVCTAPRSTVPLTYVENCAEATVLAVERIAPQSVLTLNVVDDDIPTHLQYLREWRRHVNGMPRIISVPWTMMRALARTAAITSSLLFSGKARLPGLLVPSRVHARCKPMAYPNERIRTALGWAPAVSWREGLAGEGSSFSRESGNNDRVDAADSASRESSRA